MSVATDAEFGIDGKKSPLHDAAELGTVETLHIFIEAGTDVNSHVKNTALYDAAESGDLEILEFLIAAGGDVNFDTTLVGAAERRNAEAGTLEVFTLLLVSGGALDRVDRLCHTALQVAAKNGHLEVVEALPARGANVNAFNNFGWKASDLAREWGRSDIAQILLKAEGATQTSAIPLEKHSSTGWRFREWDEVDEWRIESQRCDGEDPAQKDDTR
jgi:ankyrin repeat protein